MAAGEKRGGTLAGDLGELLESGHAADVTLVVDGVWVPAHTAVLTARSVVFAAIFEQDVLGATGGKYSVTCMNAEVLRQLLLFLYTDEAPLLDCLSAELLSAADRYCVPRLKRLCEERLVADLCVQNAAYSAVLAFAHMCPRLKAEAVDFIDSHYKEVMATDGWKNALRHHTEATVEICRMLGEDPDLDSDSECEPDWPAAAAADGEGEGSLAGDLLALLASGRASDASLSLAAGGRALPAHRALLAARSPVLARELEEAPAGLLRVGGVQEAQLRQALLYIYGDQLPEPATVTDGLLVLADDYALPGLKHYCEQQLAGEVSVENAVSLAVVATKHSCPSLRRECVRFIWDNVYEVMDTPGWAAAIRSDPEIVADISKCVAAAQRDHLGQYEDESSEDESTED